MGWSGVGWGGVGWGGEGRGGEGRVNRKVWCSGVEGSRAG